MRSTMKLLTRTFASYAVVVATAYGTERWLRPSDDHWTGPHTIKEGAPFVYQVTYYHRDGVSIHTEPVFLAANLGFFAAIALVSVMLRSRSTSPWLSRLLGRRPSSTPIGHAPWSIGLAMAATSLLVALGIFLQGLRWIGP